jgi:hypothetical protein
MGDNATLLRNRLTTRYRPVDRIFLQGRVPSLGEADGRGILLGPALPDDGRASITPHGESE